MNKNNILTTARNIFSQITPINDDLYRAELNFNSKKPAGIFYLDFSDKIKLQNIDEYQKSILSDDFFNNSGSLQWNYYLILLQDEIELSKKKVIEQNDQFARKFVFNENEFNDYFKLEESVDSVNENIVVEWKKNLDNADLQEVYLDTPVTPALVRFYENNTHKKKEKVVNAQEDALLINNVTSLRLNNNYRKFPLIRDFKFGRVNLVTGINGSGKTSLFEAVEYMICGRVKTNPTEEIENGAVEIFYNNGIVKETYKKGQNAYFRKRDLDWYSNNYTRENNLYESFNRYNYFNSDAAFNFANGNDDLEVRDALFNLVLGSEYNFIVERADKFNSNIKTEYNRLEKDLEANKKTIIDATVIIDSPAFNKNVTIITENIFSHLEALQLKQSFKDIASEYILVETINNQIKTLLQNLVQFVDQPLTKKAIVSNIERVALQQSLIDLAKVEIDKLDKEIYKLETQNLVALQKQLEVLQNSNKYFLDERLFQIEGIKERLDKTTLQISNIEKIKNLNTIVSFESDDAKLPLREFLEVKTKNLSEVDEEILVIDKAINQSLETLDKYTKIVTEIKFLGHKFLEMENHSNNCPLCQSEFSSEELMMRLKEIPDGNDINSNNTETLNHKKIKLLESQLSLRKAISDGLLLESVARTVLENNFFETETLNNLINNLKIECEREVELKSIALEMEQIITLILETETSESDFLRTKYLLTEYFPNLIFAYKNKDEFFKIKARIENELNEILSDLEKAKIARDNTFNGLVQNFPQKDAEVKSLQDIEEYTKVIQERWNSAFISFTELEKIITISEEKPISFIEKMSTMLGHTLETLKRELKQQFEIDSAKELKSKAEKFIEENTPKFRRLKMAKSTLSKLTPESAGKEIEDFFSKNIAEIVDIFKSVHTPQEFKSLRFEKKELLLIDLDDKQRKICEISTGQRSALALSIFLSLNRKLKSGPQIIMFDDPVAFIDDLNAISFLDFLRNFVLKENRQIFFATANTKLSSLFSKKFEFLDDDFKLWQLDRNEILNS